MSRAGAAAAYPSVSSSANASSTTSTGRGGSGAAGAARAASAAFRAPRGMNRSPTYIAIVSASRYVSRARAGFQRLEVAGRAEQQPGRVAALALVIGDLPARVLRLRGSQRIRRAGFDGGQQRQGGGRRPASRVARAAASIRCARRAGPGVSTAARSTNAAAAAGPPRACARPADRSSSAASSSSGPAAACARCQARRSGSATGSVAAASAPSTRRRSAGEADR
jgi:hypothetical protein